MRRSGEIICKAPAVRPAALRAWGSWFPRFQRRDLDHLPTTRRGASFLLHNKRAFAIDGKLAGSCFFNLEIAQPIYPALRRENLHSALV